MLQLWTVVLHNPSILGSHATWKTWNFVIFLSRPGKCLEFAKKVVKPWNFNSKPGKKSWNLQILCFKLHFWRCHLQKIILIYIFVISTLSTQTDSKPNWPWISLLLPGNNLENTWNFVSPDKWEPCLSTS